MPDAPGKWELRRGRGAAPAKVGRARRSPGPRSPPPAVLGLGGSLSAAVTRLFPLRLHLRICCQNQNARNPFSSPRPRQLILAVHSKAISEYEGDKGCAPHPFRACLVIRGGNPGFHLLPRPAGQAACLCPGGAVSVRPGRPPPGVPEPEGRSTGSAGRGGRPESRPAGRAGGVRGRGAGAPGEGGGARRVGDPSQGWLRGHGRRSRHPLPTPRCSFPP